MQTNTEFNDNIDKIRHFLQKITEDEYDKNDFTPVKKSAKDKAEIKESKMEVNQLRKKMYDFNKNKINNKDQKPEQTSTSTMETTTDETFNVIEDESGYIERRKLPVEERVNILNEYFVSKPNIADDIKELILNDIKEGKYTTKKDIEYDKINKRVMNIPLLKLVDGEYVLKTVIKKISIKKKNQQNINKLFKQ